MSTWTAGEVARAAMTAARARDVDALHDVAEDAASDASLAADSIVKLAMLAATSWSRLVKVGRERAGAAASEDDEFWAAMMLMLAESEAASLLVALAEAAVEMTIAADDAEAGTLAAGEAA